ncbi:MAG: prepilin-type N-terminal cleavage/methylation domain-containing protein [bacterium]|nr:prepilin-type N-terminal cleavage/methylation domain-containing protein [bacterium]
MRAPPPTPAFGGSAARRRAFTLVELVVAMGITSLLLVGMGSAIMMASRAMPPKIDPTSAALAAGSVANTLAEDLRHATAFSLRTATAVEFTVPDRTGDSTPEVIRYEWSGTPGAPLRKQFNGGAWTDVVSSIQSLALTYNSKTVSTTRDVTTTTTSPEYLFAFFNGWPSVAAPTNSNIPLTTVNWGAEFFTIDQTTIPNSAKNIRVTRVRLSLQQAATPGSVTVGIHRAVGGGNPNPAASPIGTPASVAIATIPATFGWVDFTMPADNVVAQLNKDFVIVVKSTVVSGTNVQWKMLSSTAAPKDSTPTGMWTSDSGGTWQPNNSSQYKNDNPFYAYGTYQTDSTASVTTTTYYLQTIGIAMQSMGSTGPKIATAAEVLAQPQVPTP